MDTTYWIALVIGSNVLGFLVGGLCGLAKRNELRAENADLHTIAESWKRRAMRAEREAGKLGAANLRMPEQAARAIDALASVRDGLRPDCKGGVGR